MSNVKTDSGRSAVSPEELKNRRICNSVKASVAGLFATLLTTIGPFATRMLMMRFMGEVYVGLNGVLQSAVWILNMAELGIGPVMVFFLFKPAAEGNQREVNACLMEIRLLYRRAALVIAAVGLAIMPFLDRIISDDISTGENIYLLYLLHLSAIVLQYIVWPEAASALAAFQRMDLQYIVVILVHSAVYVAQVVAICVCRSLSLYIFMVIVQAAVTGCIQKFVCLKYLKGYIPAGRLDASTRKDVRKRILSMFGHQMDEKVLGSVDNLFVSCFSGLDVVAVYGNYVFVVTAVSMLLNTVYNAVLSGIGNALIVETKEANRVRFDCMSFLSCMLAGWSTACLLCMYQTFMKLWMPGHLLPMDTVVLMCIYSYAIQMRRSVQTFKNAGGMWYSDRAKPYVSILVDLLLDYFLIRFWGLKGAVISTIICVVLIEYPWESAVLFRDYFDSTVNKYARDMAWSTLLNLFITVICYFTVKKVVLLSGIAALGVEFLLCSAIFILLYVCVYRNTAEFKIWLETFRLVKGGIANE